MMYSKEYNHLFITHEQHVYYLATPNTPNVHEIMAQTSYHYSIEESVVENDVLYIGIIDTGMDLEELDLYMRLTFNAVRP